jgi:hypothetical protein
MNVGIDLIFFDNTSLDDLTPGSAVLNSLNGNPGLEMTANRQAIYCELDEGYGGGPARLALDGPGATAIGNDLAIWSFQLENDGLNVIADIPGDDPNYYWHNLAGWSLIDLSDQIYNMPVFWHYDIVGGVPNDAVVPYTSQAGMPNSVQTVCFGLAHTQESSASVQIANQLRAITTF